MKSSITRHITRGRRFLVAASAVAAGALVLAGCSGNGGQSGEGGSGGGDVVIGVAMKTQVQPRWAFDVKYMKAEAKKLGVKLIVQWANDDADKQSSQVENLLSQGVKALIINPVDSKAAGSLARKASNEKVPVIAYDIGIQGVPVDYSVIRDNPKVGVLQAEAALKFAPEGKYALIEGDPANDVAQAIHKGHLKILKGKAPQVVYDQFTKNWDPSTAVNEAENILSANNDQIKAFLTANDGMATGVVQALKGRGLGGKVFVSGLDADPANLKLIDQGLQTMTVWTQIDKEASIAVDVATKLAKGEKVSSDTKIDNGSGTPIPTGLAPVQEINKDNLCEFVTKIAPKGWVDASEVFSDPSQCPAS